MSAVSDPVRGSPDVITYLNVVKLQLSEDRVVLQSFLAGVRSWLESQSLNDDNASEMFILQIASLLRCKPRLLYGFNALLGPIYRLEYSDTVDEVRFLVLVKEKSARIFSTVSEDIPSPSSTDELRTIIISPSSWRLLLDRDSDRTWLTCISQLLQVVSLSLPS
ncbi:hypothetical protein M413DRAFT_364993 [Hebeloma cylindrosporum]|uniref:Uncharacterized protein n=1 Tax=Hebeloma cylindrosporum TaxID=76867 RepID=A0A0C3CM71_HEBCY|nr:hypothetical protein M413DRAFT_364993 [Hebeloma cylindrosporum h7]